MGLSQSAVSHALARLRLALGDDLFVRGPSGLRPTPRAAEMGESIRAALRLMEAAVSASPFDPATAHRVFQIAVSGYAGTVLMPPVARRVLAEAPGVRLRLRGVSAAMADDLDRGRLDMIIDSLEQVAPRFAYTPLFTETGVWVLRAGHPAAARGLTLASLAALPHLMVGGGDAADAGAASAIGGLGLRRTTSWGDAYALDDRPMRNPDSPVSVPDSYSALAMVSQTDMTALLPRRLAAMAAQRDGLVLIEPGGRAEPVHFGAAVRKSDGEAGAVAWLLALVREVAAAI
jgi:DNA-binding transcriptional LysR family regulator